MSKQTRMVIAGDHHGIQLIDRIVSVYSERGHEVIDLAPRIDGVIDYPPLCAAVARCVLRGDADLGIIVGGSGQGEVIACNKVPGIRAGIAYTEFSVDISRGNNNANVIVIGTKVTDETTALALLDRWISTPFKGGVHAQRIAQITQIEAEFTA
jgi:ribose 5-phosphate isomerase B